MLPSTPSREAAEGHHVVAGKHCDVAGLFQGGNLVEVVVGHLHAHHVRAGVKNGQKLFGAQKSLGVHEIVINHQVEIGPAIERFEEFEHHGEGIREIVGARNQAGANPDLGGVAGQFDGFLQVGVRQVGNDCLVRRNMVDGEVHQLDAFLE
ncbi:MAG TPA: hypothetical protein VG206_08610 [Terriglobia bacterium]|nr:hypothetical protein [Terriglobia bacterium]